MENQLDLNELALNLMIDDDEGQEDDNDDFFNEYINFQAN